jgi:hypothetical protein
VGKSYPPAIAVGRYGGIQWVKSKDELQKVLENAPSTPPPPREDLP